MMKSQNDRDRETLRRAAWSGALAMQRFAMDAKKEGNLKEALRFTQKAGRYAAAIKRIYHD